MNVKCVRCSFEIVTKIFSTKTTLTDDHMQLYISFHSTAVFTKGIITIITACKALLAFSCGSSLPNLVWLLLEAASEYQWVLHAGVELSVIPLLHLHDKIRDKIKDSLGHRPGGLSWPLLRHWKLHWLVGHCNYPSVCVFFINDADWTVLNYEYPCYLM